MRPPFHAPQPGLSITAERTERRSTAYERTYPSPLAHQSSTRYRAAASRHAGAV